MRPIVRELRSAFLVAVFVVGTVFLVIVLKAKWDAPGEARQAVSAAAELLATGRTSIGGHRTFRAMACIDTLDARFGRKVFDEEVKKKALQPKMVYGLCHGVEEIAASK
jgi:hypothetical protein